MRDIREVYPTCDRDSDYFYAPSDYQPLLDSLGHTILIQKDQNGYQGDSFLLFQDGARYGILVFGWGSCSGCDALQGCDSYDEIEALRQSLHDSIQWYSKPEAMRYVREHDWEGDYSWSIEACREFVAAALELLAG